MQVSKSKEESNCGTKKHWKHSTEKNDMTFAGPFSNNLVACKAAATFQGHSDIELLVCSYFSKRPLWSLSSSYIWETCPVCQLDCLLPATIPHPTVQYEEHTGTWVSSVCSHTYAKSLHWDPDTSVLTGIKRWILWPIPQPFVVGIQVVAFVPPSASTIQPSIDWFECACQIRHKAINQIRLVPPYISHAYWSRWQYWTSYSHLLGCSSGKGTTTQHCPWILPPNAYCRL